MCWSPHPTARKLFHPAHALLVPKKIDIGNSVRPTELRAGRLVCNNGLLESRARLFFVREFRAAETEFMARTAFRRPMHVVDHVECGAQCWYPRVANDARNGEQPAKKQPTGTHPTDG